jgi:glycogen synthase
VRCLLGRGVRVTLITPPVAKNHPVDGPATAMFRHPSLTMLPVPYTTFPLANRRGTTILDRSTAYPLFGWRAGRAAARLARSNQIDLVHGLGASALGYAMTDRAASRAPLVLNPQGLEEFGATDPARAPLKRIGYGPLQMAVRRTARSADRVIATDRSLLAHVSRHLRVRLDIVRMIPNAIEPDDCDRPEAASMAPQLRARLGLDSSDLLLVSVGRLEANKGFDVLVRALHMLAHESRLEARWRAVLIGDGPQRAGLRTLIQSAGLGDRLTLCGRVGDLELHAWYEAADLFVHPTLYEGSSLVTLEAMAHRRAIVGTRAGGLPDKVLPGVNGWLVPPGDPHAIAEAIRQALSNPLALVTMGEQSRVIVEREFSWAAATDRLLDLYQEVLPSRTR